MDLTSLAPAAESPASPSTPATSAATASPVITETVLPAPDEVGSGITNAPSGLATLTLKRAGVLTSDIYAIGDDVVLGRFDTESGPVDVDFAPLPEATYISRHHARLKLNSEKQWTIEDLGSRNGTFVRSTGAAQFVRITGEQAVADGDEIALGNARFLFSIVDNSNTSSEGSSC
jgi:pSer/pThr/pTyr-binding forkhead associated (FHA) protein